MRNKSVNNGQGPHDSGAGVSPKTQRDSGFSVRPEAHWWYLV
jgi:hypothetical protein